ncbi:MAG: GIY-YIG nuclease family protein [Bacteroidetes bacterium]|nr:MAG: GIY-YIG nuclease family protein [Bacteroidota bacterium]TAG85435.1 MAG: GIY-YIG nuclease family protein [Bacteroidota bacterium]
MSKKGFVYILINPSFIKYLKIGKTQKTSEERAKELYRQAKTGIPTEFVVAYENEVSDCDLVESLVHKELEKYRLNSGREFFNLPLKDAIKTVEKVIKELEKQHKLDFLNKISSIFTPKKWWDNLSFVWQQIFRKHLNLSYEPNELDLLRAVHNIIDNCQDVTLRKAVANLIDDKKFTQNLVKWYKSLKFEKNLFNSYLPYELSEQEIEQIFKLTKIDCSNNIAVIDLKPLEKLTELKEINAMNTFVSDLSSLANLEKLENIYINYTKVDSLQPLENLPNLRKITCYATDLNTSEIERFNTVKHCEIIADTFLSSKLPTKIVKKK